MPLSVALPMVGEPRTLLWSLTVPLFAAVEQAGIRAFTDAELDAAAQRLEEVAHQCRPTVGIEDNPAKELALAFADTLPVLWGATPLTALAARWAAVQFAANARYPVLLPALPKPPGRSPRSSPGRCKRRAACSTIRQTPRESGCGSCFSATTKPCRRKPRTSHGPNTRQKQQKCW